MNRRIDIELLQDFQCKCFNFLKIANLCCDKLSKFSKIASIKIKSKHFRLALNLALEFYVFSGATCTYVSVTTKQASWELNLVFRVLSSQL